MKLAEIQAKAQKLVEKLKERTIQGLPIKVEHLKGSLRTGIDPTGEPWKQTMMADYGHIKDTKGEDGEGVDVYVGPLPNAKEVFVFHLNDLHGGVEDKVMIGFQSPEAAKACFLQHYPKEMYDGMTALPLSTFMDRLKISQIPHVRKKITAEVDPEFDVMAGGPGSGRHPGNTEPKPMGADWHPHSISSKQAFGGVMVNSDGKFLLREPSNHFDGYVWTWPKGKRDADEHPSETAVREVHEETGHKGVIVEPLPGTYTSGSSSTSNFYIMHHDGNTPDKHDSETNALKWANYNEAKNLIGQSTNVGGRNRDLAILEKAHNHLQGK